MISGRYDPDLSWPTPAGRWDGTVDKRHLIVPCSLRRMGDGGVTQRLREFVAERDWAQFHSAENLAKSIAIEAGELLECFQWGDDTEPARVRDELADVLTYCLLLADKLGVEPEKIVLDKLARTEAKYPVEKARGRSTKYDAL